MHLYASDGQYKRFPRQFPSFIFGFKKGIGTLGEATAADENTEITPKEIKYILPKPKSTIGKLSRHNCHLALHLLQWTVKEEEIRIFGKKP